MGKINRSALAGAVLAAGTLVTSQIVADAHHPEVAVECVSGPSTIRITVRAWDAPTDDEKVNHAVEVTIDGESIAVVALNAANGYRAVVDHTATATTGSHTIRATATVPWGEGEDDPHPIGVGEYREATVAFPCAGAEVGGAVTTTVPTTSVPTTSSTAPTTSTTRPEEVRVEGISVVAPPVAQQPVVARPTPPVAAQPVVTSPRLTG